MMMKNLNEIAKKGEKILKSALAMKIGKTALKRTGIVGVGLGAMAGAGYLAFRYFKKNPAQKPLEAKDNPPINNEIQTEKKIVV